MKRISSAWDDEELDEGIDEGIYSESHRDGMIDDDEISAIEAAFMRGWDEAA